MNSAAPSDTMARVAEPEDLSAPPYGPGGLGSLVPSLLAAVVGCALSIGAYLASDRAYQATQALRFEHTANGSLLHIERDITSALGVLEALLGLYAASQSVERDEFRAFIEGQSKRPAVQALEWIPRVRHEQRSALEEAARQEGLSDFVFAERNSQGELVPAAVRDEYFPVYFLEPRQGNESAQGFDLASNAVRLEALNRARDSGETVTTARITLVQETGNQYGFLVFAPVYRNGSPKEKLDQRRANLQGFVLGVFRIGDLVRNTFDDIAGAEPLVNLQIFDLSAPEGSRRLYPKLSEPEPKMVATTGLHVGRELAVGGRRWRIVATPTEAFEQAVLFFLRPWSVLAVGLLFTGLAAFYLRHITSRALVVQHLVSVRTDNLTKANDRLAREIAWRATAQEQLNVRADELARSNADLEQFASVASHDLQEPLRKVQAFGERLQKRYAESLDEQGQDYIVRMRSATARMQALITDLLSFSRVATQGQPFVRIDLERVAREVVSDLEQRIQESNAEVVLGSLPSIDGDPLQFRQLLQNLIGNALKYRRKDVEPKVQIEGEITSPQPGRSGRSARPMCRIRVTDNGIGFDQQYSDRIFGVFQRLHGRGAYEGTGVGLAICRKIAERHDGTIFAEGRPGEGACFTVMLPIDQVKDVTLLSDHADKE